MRDLARFTLLAITFFIFLFLSLGFYKLWHSVISVSLFTEVKRQFLEVQRSGQNSDLEGQVERSIADNMHLLHQIVYYDYVQAKQNCLLKA